MSSLNHTNEFSSLNTEQQINANSNQSNSKADKFAERLNAMLQYDQIMQDDTLAGCLSKSSSLANFQQMYQTGATNKQFGQSAANRSMSAQFQNTSMASNESLFNMQNYSQTSQLNKFNGLNNNQDFSSQIQELSSKNMQAQQKLKLLQLEQQQINNQSKTQQNHSYSSSYQANNTSLDENPKQKTLEKLKREQMQLKEQINNLNKQRESAQNELEILATSSTSSFRNSEAQNTILKHLNQLNENVLTLEHEINDNTPSLSPIQPEQNFQG